MVEEDEVARARYTSMTGKHKGHPMSPENHQACPWFCKLPKKAMSQKSEIVLSKDSHT